MLIRTSTAVEKAPYVAAGGTGIIAVGMPLNDWAILAGLGITCLTLIVNIYYKWRSERLVQAYRQQSLDALVQGLASLDAKSDPTAVSAFVSHIVASHIVDTHNMSKGPQ